MIKIKVKREEGVISPPPSFPTNPLSPILPGKLGGEIKPCTPLLP